MQEASNRFSKHTNEHELTSLSDYLRQLDQTKKQLVVELNLIVTQLADKIRTIEVKMNDNYQLLRKMTLAEVGDEELSRQSASSCRDLSR